MSTVSAPASVLKPERLHPGDTIGVISPGSPMKPERLYAGLAYLEARGYRVKVGQHALEREGFLAGGDEARAEDLMSMFRDPEVRAIFCSRGGYGTPRLLDRLDYSEMRRNPKILVGYSDITAMQLAIWRHSGLVTFSGPMVAVEMAEALDPFTEEWFWKTLSSPDPLGRLGGPQGDPLQALAPGKHEGNLVGGCLSLIGSLLGTPFEPEWEGAVLFAEDIQEEPYRIDRWLAMMRHAGVLERIGAAVLGQFVECVPTGETPSFSVDEVLRDYFCRLPIPVVSNLPYGHTRQKYTLPIGVRCRVDGNEGTVEVLEAAVS